MKIYNKCKVCEAETIVINESYNLVECRNCKIIFCATFFLDKELVQVYDDLYNKENAVYSNHSIVEYEKLINNEKFSIGYFRTKMINKYVLNKNCKSVIEKGSGIGLIGSYLRKSGDLDYLGIEIDTGSFLKSQKLKLNTINGDFRIMSSINRKFDVIMLWEVIEHLQDLQLFLKLAHEKLNIGGKIILSTPNYSKIYNYVNREKDKLFQDGPPIHLNFFNKNNIVNIFELTGFIDCKAHEKRFPYLNFLDKNFYLQLLRAICGIYNGSTIYFVGSKS